jgi:NAD-dependent DNA ligase
MHILRKEQPLKEIVPPTVCPSCNTALIWNNDQLFCVSDSCDAKVEKVIHNFAQVLKIKGLGPKTIEKLGISSIEEIYSLEYSDIENRLGSKSLSDKLLTQIEDSKNVGLQELLPAFSIPLFGRTASEKLCEHIFHVSDIDAEACNKAGIGPKTTESILKWKSTTNWALLPFTWELNRERKVRTQQLGEVVISGKLTTFKTKAEAGPYLEGRGYTLKDNVTKNTTILVNESGVASSKTKKAEAAGIKIITNILEI